MAELVHVPSEDLIIAAALKSEAARALARAHLSLQDMGTFEGRELLELATGDSPGYLGSLSDDAYRRLADIEKRVLVVPDTATVQEAINEVVRLSALRQARAEHLEAATSIGPGTDLLEHAGRFGSRMSSLTTRTRRDHTYTMATSVEMAREHMESWERGDPYAGSVPTGMHKLDQKMGGMERGHLFVLGADSSVGKTALALRHSRDVAQRLLASGSDKAVVLVELEMMPWVLTYRLASMNSGVNWQDVRFKRVDEEKRRVWYEAHAALKDLPLVIIKMARPTVLEVRDQIDAKLVEYGYTGGPELVVVDFIEYLTGAGSNETAVVANVVMGLKHEVAEHFETPVEAITQLNREVQQSDDKRPQLWHIKQAKTVEDVANDVGLIYWPGRYQTDVERRSGTWPNKKLEEAAAGLEALGANCQILLPKLRDGSSGATVPLYYHPQTTSYWDDVEQFNTHANGYPPSPAGRNGAPTEQQGVQSNVGFDPSLW